MPQWQRFPNAPITEALLDIRAKLPSKVDLPKLASFQNAIKDRYPGRQERSSWQASIEMKPGGSALSSREAQDGFLFTAADGRKIVQARLDGFTFNRLKPYESWDAFRDEARELWSRYLELSTPEVVSRVALRYINRIQMPLPMKDFKEYFLTIPEVGPSLPQGLANFFMRLIIPDSKSLSFAIVNQTMEPPSKDTIVLLFDIDVFREAEFAPSAEGLWEALEQLRNFKNEIFFGSLTSKAKELFK